MSADREGLLQAILDNPDDDTPRLVYADWLEDNGDAEQARFIRTQIELARLPEYDPQRIRRWYEERDLVTGEPFRRRLLKELELPAGEFLGYRRGFPWQVGTNNLRDFVAFAPKLFARYPIQALSLRADYEGRPPDLSPLADCPWLSRLRRLEFRLARLPAAEINKLQQSSHAANLSEFEFRFAGIAPDGLAALLASPLVLRLESLTLNSNDHIDLGTLLQAAESAGGPYRLRSLTVSPTNQHPYLPSLRDLLQAPLLRGLVELHLSDHKLTLERLEELISSPLMASLESLTLHHAMPGVPGVRAFAGCAALSGLRVAAPDQPRGVGPDALRDRRYRGRGTDEVAQYAEPGSSRHLERLARRRYQRWDEETLARTLRQAGFGVSFDRGSEHGLPACGACKTAGWQPALRRAERAYRWPGTVREGHRQPPRTPLAGVGNWRFAKATIRNRRCDSRLLPSLGGTDEAPRHTRPELLGLASGTAIPEHRPARTGAGIFADHFPVAVHTAAFRVSRRTSLIDTMVRVESFRRDYLLLPRGADQRKAKTWRDGRLWVIQWQILLRGPSSFRRNRAPKRPRFSYFLPKCSIGKEEADRTRVAGPEQGNAARAASRCEAPAQRRTAGSACKGRWAGASLL
jgi:uncharacterized protein (TIGR02996 family)